MKPLILTLLLLVSCAHRNESPETRAGAILSRMKTAEKYHLLRTYHFLQTLSVRLPGRMPITEGYLPGIPRLGIPSVELIGTDRSSRQIAREKKTLKLGFVGLIRDFEKTQVFGNFNEARAVDSIMGPDSSGELRRIISSGELRDLDLYLVQEGVQGRVRNYVCAQFREEDEFHCIAAWMESMLEQMGIAEEYDSRLARETLSGEHLDRLTREVLNTMEELRIL